MKIKHQHGLGRSRVYLPLSIITLTTIISGAVLSSNSISAVTNTVNAAVHVLESCSIIVDSDGQATPDNPLEVYGGTYRPDISTTTFAVACNDNNGYSLYAVGYGNNTVGNTNMVGLNPANIIPTGLDDTANSSAWSFRLSGVDGVYKPTIQKDASGKSFSENHVIPSTDTKVATYAGNIEVAQHSVITSSYNVGVNPYQKPDTYTGQVKYTLVHPNFADSEGRIYMQDLTLDLCQRNVDPTTNIGDNITVVDVRDGSTYTVKYINGQCWMTQNLRYLGDTGSAAGTMTIANNNSNVANKDITLYSLNSSDNGSFNAYADHCDSTNGYNYACVYDSGSTSTGVWYNYYAASAGTVLTRHNSTDATEDICPKNWHLPTGPNTTSNTDFNKLVGNATSDWQDPTSGLTAFGAVVGGFYNNGSLFSTSTGHGYWWSATAIGAEDRSSLIYNSSNGQFYGDADGGLRYYGDFVRCVLSE